MPELVFIISPPRSGSTLLMRMLAAHSQIYSRPEPHLFGPLAHLGYFDTVEKAPFDQFQAAQAMRELVAELPRGEEDYLDACRAYVDTIYGRLMETKGGGRRYFLDKTPANALVLPFITKLYPQAKYLVLTRHPAAVFASYAGSFFDGDYQAARSFNPILNRYIGPMARLLRERPVPVLQVGYETLVQDPTAEMQRVCAFLELGFEEDMVEYGRHEPTAKGLGDPVTVNRESRPVTSSVEKWARELANEPENLALVRDMLATVDDGDLETWGFPRATLWEPLERAAQQCSGAAPAARPLDRFRFERKLLVWLRRTIRPDNLAGRQVKRLRDLCDILLRG